MARVDFYVLTDNTSPEKMACILAAKARQQKHDIHVHTDNKESAIRLDELLWTHKDISFLPHSLADAENIYGTPILIGWSASMVTMHEVLINLGTNIPDFASAFDRIIEIVAKQSPLKEQARERYRNYRELGFELHSHELEFNYA